MHQSEFPGKLLDGEKIIWSGQPGHGLILTSRDALLIPFSLVWGGFAIFWEATVWHRKAPGLFRLWGVPFVLVGLYFIVGRFVLDAWLRSKSRYAVTNERLLILRSGPFAIFATLNLNRVPDVQMTEQANGRGTIRFGQVASSFGRGFGSWSPALDPTPQFLSIDNVQSVFNEIQQAIRSVA